MDATRSLPIGVFDSGVGGLTVLASLRQRLPGEALLYLGDTARLPYGSKSAATVASYALAASRALVGMGIKALVVADNTSSAHALHRLRAEFAGLPVIGVVEPGAAAAANASAGGRIVVIGSESTIEAGVYPRAILYHRPGATVASRATPLFVALVEDGITDGSIAEMVARHYLEPLFSGPEAADCLLLGCTHFPVLAPLLRRVLGPRVAIVDSASTTALAAEDLLAARNLRREGAGPGPVRFLATDDPGRFARVAGHCVPWGIAPEDVELVDIG